MKKTVSLLLITFLLLFKVNSQTRSVTVGSGTFSNATQFGPLYTGVNSNDFSSRHAYIYLKETFAEYGGKVNGVKVGERISEIGFNRNNANAFFFQPANVKIYLGFTDSTDWGVDSLNWNNIVSNCTLVYNGDPSAIIGNTPGIKYFPLIQPFTYYDGNLVILIEYSQTNAQSDIRFFFDNQLSAVPSRYNFPNQTKYATGGATTLPANLTQSSANHPYLDIKVLTSNVACTGAPVAGISYVTPANPCYRQPIYLSIKNGGGVNVSYKWQQSSDNITYTDIPGADSIRTAPFIPPQNATTYYRCKLTCLGTNQNSFSTQVSITPGNATIPSWSEGFEGITPPAMPSCITVQDQNKYITWLTSNSNAFQGTKNIRYPGNPFYPVPAKDWFYSPALQLNAGTTYALSYYSLSSARKTNISTYLGTAPVADSMSQSLLLNNIPEPSYKFFTKTFTAASSGIYFAGFRLHDPELNDPNSLVYIDDIKLDVAPAVPLCETLISPANNSTNVPLANLTLRWNVTPGVKAYKVFWGQQNNVKQVAYLLNIDSFVVRPYQYNTMYQWYVVPVNEGGDALNCSATAFTFTTLPEPPNCLPLYNPDFTIACWDTTNIVRFKITGELGTQINNPSDDFGCGTAGSGAVGYGDYTSISPVKLTRGFSYSGIISNSFSTFPTGTNNKLHSSIWIDFNDNGSFESNERLLNNLLHTANNMNFSIFIPAGSALGIHKMRVRNVVYGAIPDSVTGPCDYYEKGETEDYRVEILATQTGMPNVAPGLAAQCNSGASATVNAASNNNNTWVPLIDSSNRYIAAINANGNDLGTVLVKYYINNTPLPRKDFQNIYYLDRNLEISVTKQPVTPVGIRLYLLNTELTKLVNTAGSGVSGISDLNATKNNNTCSPAVVNAPAILLPQITNALHGTGPDYYVQYSASSFSSFYLHGGTTPIPVVLKSFTATRQDAQSVLVSWECTDPQLVSNFEIEYSANGQSFVKLTDVQPVANQGIYSYTDLLTRKEGRFYRLKIIEHSGKVKYSEIRYVALSIPALASLKPNPFTDNLLLSFKINGYYKVSVYNKSGALMIAFEGFMKDKLVTTANWPRGIYMLKINDQHGNTIEVLRGLKL